MFTWFGCWSRVISTSYLPCTKGDVVEHETWHSQMSDICTQQVPSPAAVSIHCVGRLTPRVLYDITSIQLLYLILGSCLYLKAKFHKEQAARKIRTDY